MLAILAAILNFAIDVQLYNLQTAVKPLLGLANQQPKLYTKNLSSTSHVLNNLDDERRQQRYTEQSGREYE
ncbi:hypothetical protein F4W18_15985 [Vibrio gigantis]|uniref:Uncharacterized protein n=1 Tax=Vibrio gigantis TaxID=296199 RepID=A0A5M9NK44_9VIBR|nr:hypothetical protein F4W18_15985 [Vibrio gigantis]